MVSCLGGDDDDGGCVGFRMRAVSGANSKCWRLCKSLIHTSDGGGGDRSCCYGGVVWAAKRKSLFITIITAPPPHSVSGRTPFRPFHRYIHRIFYLSIHNLHSNLLQTYHTLPLAFSCSFTRFLLLSTGPSSSATRYGHCHCHPLPPSPLFKNICIILASRHPPTTTTHYYPPSANQIPPQSSSSLRFLSSAFAESPTHPSSLPINLTAVKLSSGSRLISPIQHSSTPSFNSLPKLHAPPQINVFRLPLPGSILLGRSLS
jgi:hypothetical protein